MENRRTLAWLTALLLATPQFVTAQESDGPVRPMIELNRGIDLLSQGDQYSAAENLFATLLNQKGLPAGESRACRYYLAIAQIELGKYDEAAVNLDRVLRGVSRRSPEYDSLFRAHLDRGLALLLAGEPNAAKKPLEQFVRRMPTDAGHVLLGIAQYRNKSFSRAVKTLSVVVANEQAPLHAYAAFYTGLAQASKGDLDRSRESLARVAQLGTELGQRSQLILDQLAGVEAAPVAPFSSRLTLEVGSYYDTNVTLLGRRTRSTDPISSKDDYRFGLLADLDLDWRPQEGRWDGWHFNAGLTVFDSWHASTQEFNVQDYAARVYAGKTVYESDGLIKSIELGLRYDFDYALVDNDGFLSRNGLALVASVEGDRWRTFIEYQWQFRDYEEENFSRAFDRDGNYQSIEVLHQIDLREVPYPYDFRPDEARWMTLAFGYRFENNSTQGDEFDYTSHTAFAGISSPLPWNLEASVLAEIEWQNYWQRSRIDADFSARKDLVQRYVLRLNRQVNEWFSLGGEVAWTYNDSNVVNTLGEQVFSYDRVVYGITARVAIMNPHRRLGL